MPPVVIAAGIAAVGGIVGAVISNQPKTSSSTQTITKTLPAQTPAQTAAIAQQQAAYNALQNTPTANLTGFNALMEKLIANGGLPDANQTKQAQTFASNIFAPQQVSLDQSFVTQRYQANQQAAVMGREGNDPILLAKLAQLQTNAQQLLSAEQGALAAKIGLQIPQNQYQFGLSQAQIELQNAQQIAANRAATFQASNSIANQYFNQQNALIGSTVQTNGQSGGGPAEALAGGMQGIQAGFSLGNQLTGLSGGSSFAPTSYTNSAVPSSYTPSYWSGPNPYSSSGWSGV